MLCLAGLQAVEKLVLIDAQGFIDGIGPMAKLPRALAAAGVWVLQTEQLRMVSHYDRVIVTRMALHYSVVQYIGCSVVGIY
jgi:hypothetical protein